MRTDPSRIPVVRLSGLAVGLLLVLTGCESEQVQSYRVPKEQQPALPTATPTTRLLGAIYPRGDSSWFLKLTGPLEAVGKVEKEFETLARSVRFADAEAKPTWELPQGWRQLPGDAFRFATIKTGPDDSALDITVSTAGGSLIANVDRWRGQLGLRPLGNEELLNTVSREIDANGVKAILVDMKGGGSGRMFPPMQPPPTEGGGPLRYRAPEGWKETRTVPGIEIAAWQVGDAKVSVSTAGGDLRANVDRWRGQVGLNRLTDEEWARGPRKLDVSGVTASYFDLPGREKRILAAVLSHEGKTWFFKMIGPSDQVGKEQAAFEAFVQSVRLD